MAECEFLELTAILDQRIGYIPKPRRRYNRETRPRVDLGYVNRSHPGVSLRISIQCVFNGVGRNGSILRK